MAGTFAQQRLAARLTSFFAELSLILASVGLYGVTAYNAGRRINEIGVRVLLGANRRDVVRLVLRGALGSVFVGLLNGLPLTFGVDVFLGSQLYGASPFSPAVVLTAVFALGVSTVIASCIPAFRATDFASRCLPRGIGV